MELQKILTPERVEFNLKSKSKLEVIDELIDILYRDGKIKDKERFKGVVIKREEEFTTGIGMGVAIPHGKDESVVEPALVFGLSKEGIEYDSMDGKPAHIFFLIAVPNNANNEHLTILSMLSRRLMYDEVRNRLFNASSYEDVINAFKE
ncbi:PTS sugar transporter subunit IIA [Thermobrachium celere]|uniref:PTS sugar transporter subunit IIA n=1 Tax=Thermobrachium celere TaxID=53422 RepID=UPI001944B2EE|nr:PTS sugar transporter subunit IIA [Thermobrachium celere]GFR35932.1 PTS fructose transporter subunit IIA [Thermobrachium celere]